jgi:simple sugar transport system ATP-binding protein
MVPRLELRSVSKRYGGVVANHDISLAIMPGEIHAVLGENGAGKSTLMKLIYGAVAADEGEMLWDGKPVSVANPAFARRLGIGMVYQHFSLFETVTVAENIAAALDDRFDLKALSSRITTLADQFGLRVEPGRLLHHLSVGERQQVEILRCLLQRPRLLILDEPTSVLTPVAVRQLFHTLRAIAGEGCSILYISHKLDEIRELCTSATVLRGGRVVGTADPRQASAAQLAQMMVGAALPQMRHPAASPEKAARFEAIALSAPAEDAFGIDLKDISLAVRGGEIVGIAGVSGNGQQELVALLSGERRASQREAIRLDGQAVGHLDAGARRTRGLAFVPEDRLGRGAVPTMSLGMNALLTGHGQGLVRRGVVERGAVRQYAQRVIDRFNVRCDGVGAIARSLSGGNLQKFIVGREIGLAPRVLLVAQPTWGVDVAAAAFIRQALIDLSRTGTALLVISEELDELLDICDRIHVMQAGRLSAAIERDQVDLNQLGLLMAGTEPVQRAAVEA